MGIGGSVIFSTKRGSGMSGDGEDEQYFTAAVIGSVILAALAWIGLILFERPLFDVFRCGRDVARPRAAVHDPR